MCLFKERSTELRMRGLIKNTTQIRITRINTIEYNVVVGLSKKISVLIVEGLVL